MKLETINYIHELLINNEKSASEAFMQVRSKVGSICGEPFNDRELISKSHELHKTYEDAASALKEFEEYNW